MPHPIWVLLGWPHIHCADTMVWCVCVCVCVCVYVCVCEIVFASWISEEPHWKAPWGFPGSQRKLTAQLEGIRIAGLPLFLILSLRHTDIPVGHRPCQEDRNSIIPGKPSQKRDLSIKQKA